MLPAEVLQEILSYCGPEELCRAAMVCKLWRSIADQDCLWRRHCHPGWLSESQFLSCKELYLQWIQRQASRYCQRQSVPWLEQDYVQSLTYDFDALLKIVLIGSTGCGKARIMMRYTGNPFDSSHVTQIGLDIRIKNTIIDGFKVKLQIWDTAGQERFRTLTSAYYRVAHGILLVFDVGDRNSFYNLKDWLRQIEVHANKQLPIVLIGHKQAFADEHNLIYREVSANTGENIDEAFETLSRLILHNTFGVEPLPATLPRKETFLAYAKKLEERGYMIEVGSKIKPKCTIQ